MTEKKRAIITGIGGQDGSYLAEILLEKGYEVHGIYRHSSTNNLIRIKHLASKVKLWECDVTDTFRLYHLIEVISPHEVYHEADQDNVGSSYRHETIGITAGAVHGLLQAVSWAGGVSGAIRVFVPLSATIFGNAPAPQNELTPLDPRSPYACAKAAAYHLCRYWRSEGMFVSTAIFYNHDSPRRSPNYLLQNICRQAVLVAQEKQESIVLGDPTTQVDIGFAGRYMYAAQKMLQLSQPDDFIISTGQTYSIEKLSEMAQEAAGIASPKPVQVDESYVKPKDRTVLVGDPSKARKAGIFSPDDCDIMFLIRQIVEEQQKRMEWRN